MEWQKLLSTKRFGLESRTESSDYSRSQFQKDYDRIIFSSPFRRLQNKTQVFPLPGNIFVHNRLTHSLEVASVGRSLGSVISSKIAEQNLVDGAIKKLTNEFGTIVATSCLAHDLGNPPFGHSGEKAISRYFTTGNGKSLKGDLSYWVWADLTNFEGNANALRILTHQFLGRRAGGFNLTYATLATLLKYPCNSTSVDWNYTHRKKYGYFKDEEETFKKISEEVNLLRERESAKVTCRHPLVFLMEAADDICYQIIDLEDAHRLGILSHADTKDLLMGFFPGSEERASIDNILQTVTDKNEQIAYLRAKVISKLIMECADIFLANYEKIMEGQFYTSLIDELGADSKAAMDTIIELSYELIYNHRSVVEVELAGYNVLGGLLEEFIDAIIDDKSQYAKKLLHLLPKQFLSQEEDIYHKIMSVVDFVSGMTDLYAIDLFRKIRGISFRTV